MSGRRGRRRPGSPIAIPAPNALRIWGWALDGPGALEFAARISEYREDELGLLPARAWDDWAEPGNEVRAPDLSIRPVRPWLRLPWVVEAMVRGLLTGGEPGGSGPQSPPEGRNVGGGSHT